MRLPLPFARVWVDYGEALSVAREQTEAQAEAARQALETRLERLSRALDLELAGGA
jgi:lysophospholipid acyltransferase (LPLAT)-like uncharacterized protein